MSDYLVCGFKFSGKDTLFQQLTGVSQIPWNWAVYSNGKSFNPPKDLVRFGFADELRNEVRAICPPLPDDIENRKEEPLAILNGKSWRDLLIEHGAKRRAEDIDYWVNSVYHKINGRNVMITDLRYINEYNFFRDRTNSITIRVFRKDVPIPDWSIVSEHDLDHITTDFVLIPEHNQSEEFAKLIEVFPQYANFIRIQ